MQAATDLLDSIEILPPWLIEEALSSQLVFLLSAIFVLPNLALIHIRRFIQHILDLTNPQLIEYCSATAAILLAGALDTARHSPFRAELRYVMPISLWSGLSAAVGIFQFMATRSGHRQMRARGAIAMLIYWLFILTPLTLRGGFTLLHPFLIPLALGMLCAYLILTRGDFGKPNTSGP